jgi:hypothetical protein
VTAVADRRRAFAWLDLEALERIDAHAPEAVAAGVRNVYLALAQTAARRFDGDHVGFEATRQELAAVARTSTKTIDRHVAELERLGLVCVERRQATSGSPLASRYVLVDPPAQSQGHEVATPATSSPEGGDTKAALMSPLRARPDGVKEKEERERERARAEQPESPVKGNSTETEQAIAAELGALLAERGQQLSSRDRLAIRSAVHATPAGVDAVAAAARLHRNYGSGGKAANRRIGDVVAVLIAEIEQSTPARQSAEQPVRRGRRRREREFFESPAACEQRRAAELRIHPTRPPALDPPSKHLQAAWAAVRPGLESGYTGLGALIDSVGLAGTLTMLVEDAGEGEAQQRVIVLDAPPDQLPAIAARGRQIANLFGRVLGVDGVIVEIAPRGHTAAAGAPPALTEARAA